MNEAMRAGQTAAAVNALSQQWMETAGLMRYPEVQCTPACKQHLLLHLHEYTSVLSLAAALLGITACLHLSLPC
jgi:hypothetical protein